MASGPGRHWLDEGPQLCRVPDIMDWRSLSPFAPTRLKLPVAASFMRISFSRISSACFRFDWSDFEPSFSALASCFVACASQTISSSSQPALMSVPSEDRSALTLVLLDCASACAICVARQVSSCVLVLFSCVSASSFMTSTLASASIRATLPSSSALTLRCSNVSSACFLRPLSETSTCSPFLLISSICISDSCLIFSISNSFWRSSFSIALSIFVVASRLW
mmetsp:Transcript_36442/g.82360  ORF Transcript_36442/g.82360 Transcript_36442/m.82360 type:complete len:223 (+) Transcript_36442:95-763(+)